MKSEAAHDALLSETLEQAEDRRFVTLLRQSFGTGQFPKSHRTRGLKQGGNELLKGFGSPHAELSAAVDGFRDDRIHGVAECRTGCGGRERKRNRAPLHLPLVRAGSAGRRSEAGLRFSGKPPEGRYVRAVCVEGSLEE